MKYLEPRYKIPHRTTFSRSVIPELYDVVSQKVKDILEAADHISCTTDMWSSLANDDFLSLTCHFISPDFEKISVCVEVVPFSYTGHTGQNICDFITQYLGDWGITSKVHLIVRDNAANMVRACELLQIPSVGCAAHTLQLVIKESLLNHKNVSDVCSKVRRVVGHFRHSISANKRLTEFQEANKMPCHKLKHDEPTRWDSTYIMLERFLEQRRAISYLGPDLNLNVELTNADWELVGEIVKLLKFFFMSTQTISNENTSISEVIPLVNGLTKHLSTCKPGNKLKSVYTDMVRNLNTRYADMEKNVHYSLNTLLDPRFKQFVFSSEEDVTSAKSTLEQQLSLLQTPELHSPALDNNAASSSDTCHSIHYLYTNLISSSSSVGASTSLSPTQELTRYLEEPLCAIDTSPLLYWKTSPHQSLKKLARKYLSAPCGSVASERLFSTAGALCTKKRSSMNPRKLRKLVFLNKNSKYL